MIRRAILLAAALATVPLAGASSVCAQPARGACNTAGAAVLGGLLGALAGRAIGGRGASAPLAGAAIGAMVGGLACSSANARTTRSRSNREVMMELGPQAPTAGYRITDYSAHAAAPAYRRGEEVRIESSFSLADAGDAHHELIERYVVTSPDGQTRDFTKPIANDGGQFTHELSLTLPGNVQSGEYHVNTTLLVDGAERAGAQTSFHLI